MKITKIFYLFCAVSLFLAPVALFILFLFHYKSIPYTAPITFFACLISPFIMYIPMRGFEKLIDAGERRVKESNLTVCEKEE
jgi:hypothetical protein